MAKGFDRTLAQVYTTRPMRVVVGALAVSLVLGAVVARVAAQETPEDKQADVTTEREDAQRKDRPPSGDDMNMSNIESLSPAEMQTRSETMLKDMRDALRRVTEILGEARGSKDIVQLNCVNEKVTQIKGLLRISEE